MVDSMMIELSTLRAATGDFDDSNKLGEGGFGAVYKVLLPNTQLIKHGLSISELNNRSSRCSDFVFFFFDGSCSDLFRASSRTAKR